MIKEYEINEANYANVIYPTKFEEMVDASINLSEPILFYDVKPNYQTIDNDKLNNDILKKYKLLK